MPTRTASAPKTSAAKTAQKTRPAAKRAAAGKAKARPVDGTPNAAAAPVSETGAKKSKSQAPEKPVKAKLVRDGFTMPASDFALIAMLKARAIAGRREAKKSELLRAGLHALAQLDGDALVLALNRLEPVKTGRPKKAH